MQSEFYKKCIQAFKDSDIQVVMSIGKAISIENVGFIPDNFVIANHVPQLEILKRADVFITHGGMNGTCESLYYGVPLISFPQGKDQFLVSHLIKAKGAGIYIDNMDTSPEELKEVTMNVYKNDMFESNCKIISESFKYGDGAIKAADEIERYLGTVAAVDRPGKLNY